MSASKLTEEQALRLVEGLARASSRLNQSVHASLSNTHGIGFSDFLLLRAIRDAPGSRRVDLAQRVGLTASGVTRALLPLEKIGLVARVRDEKDARASRAELTEAGTGLLDNATVSASESAHRALGLRLGDTDYTLLLSVIDRLI